MDEVEQLESGRRGALSVRALAIFAAAAMTATLVGVSWSWHPGRHPSTRSPAGPEAPATNSVESARPSSRPSTHPPDAGTVFVQPLADCVRTDHRRDLRIAVAIQNLADVPLQLVSVDMIGRIPGLTLKAQTVGVRPCGDQQRAAGGRMSPAEEAVVVLDFAVAPACPAPHAVTARLGFLDRGTVLHAETANLVDLTAVKFDQCR